MNSIGSTMLDTRENYWNNTLMRTSPISFAFIRLRFVLPKADAQLKPEAILQVH